jgi:transcriptional regulator GlxA family with amidase domain
MEALVTVPHPPSGSISAFEARGVGACAGDDAARRAIDFMMGRLDEPLSIPRLARGSGLSTRTLHRVIRREYGVPPMALLRRARLARVRLDLQAPRPGTTVTTAAMRWGFSHLGRFSADYARQFGEAPSDTLRRAGASRFGTVIGGGAIADGTAARFGRPLTLPGRSRAGRRSGRAPSHALQQGRPA